MWLLETDCYKRQLYGYGYYKLNELKWKQNERNIKEDMVNISNKAYRTTQTKIFKGPSLIGTKSVLFVHEHCLPKSMNKKMLHEIPQWIEIPPNLFSFRFNICRNKIC
jgi:hypothetical protein